ncbi:hypothetical protein F4859DRAFT_483498 [Xylaria cf. heliscus]|nr:hypothetical protein F4859DRAFT_483498 [Xylaria cf. heliscus]
MRPLGLFAQWGLAPDTMTLARLLCTVGTYCSIHYISRYLISQFNAYYLYLYLPDLKPLELARTGRYKQLLFNTGCTYEVPS